MMKGCMGVVCTRMYVYELVCSWANQLFRKPKTISNPHERRQFSNISFASKLVKTLCAAALSCIGSVTVTNGIQ